MQIHNIQNCPVFCAKKSNSDEKSGMDLISDVFSSTSQNIEDIDEIVSTAKNAIDSPEGAAMRTLNTQLEKVIDSEKTPKQLKIPATYISAGVISVVTFFATKNLIKAPNKFIKMAKKHLDKTITGKKFINFASTFKSKITDIADSLKGSKFWDLKEFLGEKAKNAADFFTAKFPKAVKYLTDIKHSLHLDKYTRNDYLKNGFSGVVALTSGLGYLNKKRKKQIQEQNNYSMPNDDVKLIKVVS